MSDLPSRLPAALADRDDLAEIETTASLRHPDILPPIGPAEATPDVRGDGSAVRSTADGSR